MRSSLERKVTVRLSNLHELFSQPQHGSARPVSGMQELFDVVALQTRFLTRPCAYQINFSRHFDSGSCLPNSVPMNQQL